MKALENRTNDSKIEMDIIDALDEIRSLNTRNATIKPDDLIEHFEKKKEEVRRKIEEIDDHEIESVEFNNKRLINDEDEEEFEASKKSLAESENKPQITTQPTKKLKVDIVQSLHKNANSSKPKTKPIIPKVVVQVKKEVKKEDESLFDY